MSLDSLGIPIHWSIYLVLNFILWFVFSVTVFLNWLSVKLYKLDFLHSTGIILLVFFFLYTVSGLRGKSSPITSHRSFHSCSCFHLNFPICFFILIYFSKWNFQWLCFILLLNFFCYLSFYNVWLLIFLGSFFYFLTFFFSTPVENTQSCCGNPTTGFLFPYMKEKIPVFHGSFILRLFLFILQKGFYVK